MRLKILEPDFSICQVRNLSGVNYRDEFFFIAKTNKELSLICQTRFVPTNYTVRNDGWKMLVVDEKLDFSVIGLIANIARILAENKISIIVQSTYDTDFVMVQEQHLIQALRALSESGYQLD